VTNPLYVDLKEYANGLSCTQVTRDLRNLAVETVHCWKIELATYPTTKSAKANLNK